MTDLTQGFTYQGAPSRVLFGVGMLARVAAEIEGMGCKRAFLLSTPFQAADIATLAKEIGPLVAGTFTDAQMHTPVDVTKQALAVFEACGADCIVSMGGGSTIGLGKAIAWRNDAPHLVIATTYAGSEVTDILGQTEGGVKSTVRDLKIRPEVVIYDAALTTGLPIGMSVSSGLNAMAHAIEGLYAPDANPVTSLMAVEGIRALKAALPLIVRTPDDIEARSSALYGSWLCGVVLGSVAMSLHHKLCHTLGGACDLPHAETHAILLPHTAAYNASAAARELSPASALFGGDLSGGLYDLSSDLNAPRALRDLGLDRGALDHVADLAVRNPYSNPRDVTRDGIMGLLLRAYDGTRPEQT
ncbi:maleylacetate reductase [Paracoccus liaowanqingii]|uniref:Maleylacetate reductase n=1 Tax=Paracoccus liaowanqingii TaxID=2560053 RepID=A0A4Z1CTP4_9RHOB|nr:maleylacetate reductase [Paracoccus liaowanqingii]TGN68751.1 maleylacetate reductase [Paracoccus liaowanqingii]